MLHKKHTQAKCCKLNSTGMEIKGEVYFVHAHAMHIQNTSPMDRLNAVKCQKILSQMKKERSTECHE